MSEHKEKPKPFPVHKRTLWKPNYPKLGEL